MNDVVIYAIGLCYMSACAPGTMAPEAIERDANLQQPTGISHDWRISKNETFLSGDANPCPCDKDPERKHWLLEC